VISGRRGHSPAGAQQLLLEPGHNTMLDAETELEIFTTTKKIANTKIAAFVNEKFILYPLFGK